MAIFRGIGGAGDSTTDATITAVTEQATNAANSATAAASSASSASSSASAASTSASNAATSASAASAAQTAAEAAQAAAEAVQEAIDALYLGAQASDPSVDLNGSPLTAGDWYYNTTTGITRIYDGSAWQNGAVNGSLYLQTANNLSDLNSASTARTNLGLGSISTQDSNSVSITGGAIDGTTIGGTTAAAGTFDGLTVSSSFDAPFVTLNAGAVTTTGDITAGTNLNALGGVFSQDITFTGNSRGIHFNSVPDAELYINHSNKYATLNLLTNSPGFHISAAGFPVFTFTKATGDLTAGSFTATGGTANGVTYLNGSKTLTSGSALTFDGTNLGIGTTSPSDELEVSGDARITSAAPTLKFSETDTTNTNYQIRLNGGDLLFQTNNDAFTSSATRLTLDSTGNVGIGTSPGCALDVVKASTTTGDARFNIRSFDFTSAASGVGGGIAFTGYITGLASAANFATIQGIKENGTSGDYASAMVFTTRANGGALTERARIDSSGNFGVGTDSPTSKLDVAGIVTADGADVQGVLENSTSGQTVGQYLFRSGSVSGGWGINYDGTNVDDSTRSSWAIIPSVALGEASTVLSITSRSPGDAAGAGKNRLRIDNAGDVSFYEDTGTTAKFFWDASAESLGIGTSSPTNVKLQLNNAGTDTVGTGNLGFAGGSTPLWVWRLSAADADLNLDRYSGSWQSIPALTVKRDTGNIGIGATAPINSGLSGGLNLTQIASSGYPIYELGRGVNTDSSNMGFVAFVNTNNTGADSNTRKTISYIGSVLDTATANASGDSGGILTFHTKADAGALAERLRIDSSGNVGIGTSSPVGNLVVSTGAVGSANSNFRHIVAEGTGNSGITIMSGSTSIGALNFGDSADNDVGSVRYDHNVNSLHFNVNAAERVRIDSSGNLLVGTTSLGTIGSTTGVALYADGRVMSSNVSNGSYFARMTTDGAVMYFRKNTTTVGSISVTGSSTAFNTSSDYRLKENVVGVTGAAARVQQLNPVRFNFIADPDKTVDGFLAHEVQDVVPEAITGTKDAVDAEGNPEYQGIDQSKLVPLLTAALQEALTKIDALTARIEALEGN